MNVIGIRDGTRMEMLHDFCTTHDTDILLIQEVTHTNFENVLHRNKYFNTGTNRRGTAIFTKDHITLTNINQLPSGRGIAGWQREAAISEKCERTLETLNVTLTMIIGGVTGDMRRIEATENSTVLLQAAQEQLYNALQRDIEA